MNTQTCAALPTGDIGGFSRIEDSFPTSFTCTLIDNTSGGKLENITVHCLAFKANCGQGIGFGYIDPDDKQLYILTGSIGIDENNNPKKFGFKTLDNNKQQINKVLFNREFTFDDMLAFSTFNRSLGVGSASDGSKVDETTVMANPNTLVFEKYSVNQAGGRRKTRRNKKSKRHTRR